MINNKEKYLFDINKRFTGKAKDLLIEQNGISINQKKESNVDRVITKDDFTDGFILYKKVRKYF